MENRIKIYPENYSNLPKRFVKKIEADLEQIQRANFPGLKGVYLFGSCARGKVRSSSDVDLLILTEDKLEDRQSASEVRWLLQEEICGVGTDVVYMNEKSILEDSVFKKMVNRDKKIILEVVE